MAAMKVATLLLLLAALVLGGIALRAPEPQAAPPLLIRSDSVPYELHGAVPPDCVVRTFEVEGMCCDGCAGKLHAAVSGVPGVEQAAVDSVMGRVQVVVPRGLELARIEKALTFDDYRVTSAH